VLTWYQPVLNESYVVLCIDGWQQHQENSSKHILHQLIAIKKALSWLQIPIPDADSPKACNLIDPP